MDPRQERGLVIAATQKLIQKGKVWLVPSQTGNGKKYTVCPDPESPFCSCPDHEETGGKCKHLYAVEFVMRRDTAMLQRNLFPPLPFGPTPQGKHEKTAIRAARLASLSRLVLQRRLVMHG